VTRGIRRRIFLKVAGGILAWPAAALAQQAKAIPRIGVLFIANPEPFKSAFLEGLRRRGYVEGQSIHVEFRSADGNPDLLPKLAAEFIQAKVDIIVATQTPAVQAAKNATTEIPIVMQAGDPVGTGLVASLARPGGNITGMSSTTAELGGKTLEFLRELRPATTRVAVLANAADPFTKPFLAQLQSAGKVLRIEISPFVVHGPGEFKSAFTAIAKLRADAVIVQPSLPRKAALELVMQHRLPSLSPTAAFVNEGGLLSYSAKLEDQYRGVADYVDKILKGAKPADLPIQQATTFELAVNLKTARAIGVTIPKSILARADRVIE